MESTALAISTDLAWPQPPLGEARKGTLAAAAAAPPSGRRPWYASLGVTVAAFVVLPPLGLILAWRFHSLWQRPLWIRITAITLAVAFTVTMIGVGDDASETAAPAPGPQVSEMSAPAGDPATPMGPSDRTTGVPSPDPGASQPAPATGAGAETPAPSQHSPQSPVILARPSS